MPQRDETLAFLRCVLPSEGYYCAVIFDVPNPKPGVDKPRQLFFNTIEELTDATFFHDTHGRTVFHACSSFRTRGNRKHTNVHAIRSLWFDVDAGPTKHYPDAPAAARAVVDFCDAVSLPYPVFVGSGFGIHCYWPLTRDLAYDEWHHLASALKSSAVHHGLQVDPSRTTDASSVLRPPGTHNRKNGERLVQCEFRETVSFSPEPFERLESVTGRSLTQNRVAQDHTRTQRPVGRSRVLDRITAGNYGPASHADIIADGCAQMAALRRSGGMGGLEGWYVRLGVLAFCEDGDLKAHEWSSNDYPEYSHAQTQFKLDRARALLTGATTCAKLNAVSPNICASCVHWGKINSPIVLGQVRAEPPRELPVPLDVFACVPDPPAFFKWSSDWQLIIESDNPGKSGRDTIVVTDTPIYLDTVQTGELDHSSYSYSFKNYMPRTGWNTITLDAGTLFGAAGISTMFSKGAVIHEAKPFLKYVRHQVDEYHREHDTELRYDQFGWKNDDSSFLFGKMLYTPAGPVESIGAKEVHTRSQWLGPSPRGHLVAWTEAADNLFASDMEGISAAVLSSFAAVLMRFQSQDEGGAILHLTTPDSGKGKTTALMGAWTVWGTREGLSLTNEDTRVSKPITLGVLGNLPVFYDELRDKDPEVIRRMVVTFTEGRDRMRGMVDGTIRHTKANWQTVMLSAANGSLIEQLQTDGTDAPAYRVLELGAKLPDTVDKAKGDRWRSVLTANAGHAGHAYINYLTQPATLSWARAALEKWTAEIWETTKLGSAHRFRVRLVGAIAVASALVNKLDILHFHTDRIIQFLIKELQSDQHEGTVASLPPLDKALNLFGDFMNFHMGEALVVKDPWRPKTYQRTIIKPNNRVSMRYEMSSQKVYISISVFREWATKRQVSAREIINTLVNHQVLDEKNRTITLPAGTDIPGSQVSCLVANAAHPVMGGLLQMVSEGTPREYQQAKGSDE